MSKDVNVQQFFLFVFLKVCSADLDGDDRDLDDLHHQLPWLPATSSELFTGVHEEVFEFSPEALHLLLLMMGQ